MHRIRRLTTPVRSYAWGSRTVLAELQGRPSPSAGPEAELWMGAHPRAPSAVEAPEGPVALDVWIARDPVGVLGAEAARAFGGQLPFLLKLLAVEAPLSLQTHPDEEQARGGFARERVAGLAPDAVGRSFPDPRAKRELICALGSFEALCGLRAAEEIAPGLAALGAPAAAALAALERGELACVRELWGPGTDRGALCRQAERVADLRRTEPDWRRVAELVDAYPGDLGVLAPLLLHHVALEPGEALYLPPGELHAYLRGTGVELMSNSDNVLRAGLTAKHVDVPELLAALRPPRGVPKKLRARPRLPAEGVYTTPAREFELGVVVLEPGRGFSASSERGVEILVCVEGAAHVEGATAEGAEHLVAGQALLAPASAGRYALEGSATLYRAGVPASA